MTEKALWLSLLLAGLVAFAGGPVQAQGRLVFREDFSHGATGWWTRPTSRWETKVESGDTIFCLVQPGKMGRVRAPTSWAVRRGVDVSSYVFEGRFRSTAPVRLRTRDLCVFFNFQDSLHFGYVHFSAKSDRVHNIIGLVNGRDRVKINLEPPGKSQARLVDQAWHRFRVTYDGRTGRVLAFLDDFTRLVLTAVDTVLRHGSVGVGSFDDTGCFDALILQAVGDR